MNVFTKSSWIWPSCGECDDQYAEFYDTVTYTGGKMRIRLSADSDYALFVGGSYAASGQYGDFEHYKIYDTIDLTPFLRPGENTLMFLVYHCGTPTFRYVPARAGLIYEIEDESGIVGYSCERVLCRQSPFYQTGLRRLVTLMLGYTFAYNACGDGTAPCEPAVCIGKTCEFYPRPIKKSAVLGRREMVKVTNDGDTHYLVDLGGEVVGLPELEFVSSTGQKLMIAWGEHILDGGVRRESNGRHFFFEYTAHAGLNRFTEYMLRLGCRYIEIFAEAPIELRYAGILPQVYEVRELPCTIEDELDRRIYDISVNTLKLCMMEHYVDCPLREQALYAFDSRNQMRFGYNVFVGGNADYVRANLRLIGKDRREDRLLSITSPCGHTLIIPSFSLHYISAVWEYTEFSGDTALAKEVIGKLTGILDVFAAHRENGLITVVKDPDYWNFYDWSPHADRLQNTVGGPDLFLNSLVVLALRDHEKICRAIGCEFPYDGLAYELLAGIRREFLDECGLFSATAGAAAYTELGNALAILAGAATGAEAVRICDAIAAGELIPCSLSNKIFVYGAMIDTDREKYRSAVLSEIRREYKVMLDFGSDTVWETKKRDNGGMGSLCHGWSAVPVYVYHRLGIAKKQTD